MTTWYLTVECEHGEVFTMQAKEFRRGMRGVQDACPAACAEREERERERQARKDLRALARAMKRSDFVDRMRGEAKAND